MHTVDLLARALETAAKLGYEVRQEHLGGSGSGGCAVRGRKLLFLDLADGPSEQLESVLELLAREAPDELALLTSGGELRRAG